MSRRNLERRPLRALSDSEGEEDISNIEGRSRIHVRATRSSAIYQDGLATVSSSTRSSNHLNLSNHAAASLAASTNSSSYDSDSGSGDYHNNVNNGRSSLNSSQLNRSLVQESTFDRIRWAVWGYIYLKIISWISFDVWLLSRLRGSRKACALLFLPLLLYLLYCAIRWNDLSSLTSFINSFSTTSTTAQCWADPVFHGFLVYFKTKFTNILSLLPSLSSFSFLYTAMFEKRSSYVSSETQEQGYKFSVSSEELELLVKKILQDQKYQGTNIQDFKSSHFQEEWKDLQQQVKIIQQFQSDLQRSSNTKDAEIRSAEKKVDVVSNKLKILEEQIAAFENRQKFEKSSSSKDIEKLSAGLEIWKNNIKILEEELVSQKLKFKGFRDSFEKKIVAAFQSVVNGDKTSPYYFFSQFLSSKSEEINLVIEHLRKEQLNIDNRNHKVIEGFVRHYIESLKISNTFETHNWDYKSVADVHKIIRDAIRLYDADKTGLVDYALESSGGSVISIRCSESYAEKRGMFSLFGLPLWTDQNSPRIAIQPGIQPGQCWSFKGSQGFLVIQLSYAIQVTGFTLEHIPVSLSPTGSIDSAPREFSVWALSSESDKGTQLGQYSYDDKGEPLQYFTVQNTVQQPTSYVELKILSNHGNLGYTCLYRFRVHGKLV